MTEYKVLMQKLSLTMEKGIIVQWHKHVGDKVAVGDTLAEVTTDKVNMELESVYDGVIVKLMAEEGDNVPVMSCIAVIDGPDGQTVFQDETEETPAVIESKKASPQMTVAATERVAIAPAAKKLAEEKDIDYRKLAGSGPNGRIVLADVEAALANQPQMSHLAAVTVDQMELDYGQLPRGKRLYQRDILSLATGRDYVPMKREKLTSIQDSMRRNMLYSWNNTPHVTLNRTVSMNAIIALRTSLKEEYGEKVSYNDFVLKATVMALELYPIINSSLDKDEIVYHEDVNLGIATDTERGLLVPVVKAAQKLSLLELSKAASGQTAKARENRLSLADISGGTFTVTNLGVLGIDSFNPIINPPESAILAVGAIHHEPTLIDGVVINKACMTISISFDHRHIDGATAARFLGKVAFFLENPYFYSI